MAGPTTRRLLSLFGLMTTWNAKRESEPISSNSRKSISNSADRGQVDALPI